VSALIACSGAAAVDYGGAHDVRFLFEGEAFGDAIVDDGLAIAVDADDLVALTHHTEAAFEPTSDDHAPEQNVGSGFAQCVGEMIEDRIVELGIQPAPGSSNHWA
jgi:hypothetical protein